MGEVYMPSDEFTIVGSYPSESIALVVQQALDDAGIASYLSSQASSSVHPHLVFSLGVDLIVKKADAEKASEIVNS